MNRSANSIYTYYDVFQANDVPQKRYFPDIKALRNKIITGFLYYDFDGGDNPFLNNYVGNLFTFDSQAVYFNFLDSENNNFVADTIGNVFGYRQIFENPITFERVINWPKSYYTVATTGSSLTTRYFACSILYLQDSDNV